MLHQEMVNCVHLQNSIHENIKYLDLSKTQSRALFRASGAMKIHIKLLAHKKPHSIILEYSIKYKSMKEVVSAMNIINNFSTQEIIRQNKCQIRFLYK